MAKWKMRHKKKKSENNIENDDAMTECVFWLKHHQATQQKRTASINFAHTQRAHTMNLHAENECDIFIRLQYVS